MRRWHGWEGLFRPDALPGGEGPKGHQPCHEGRGGALDVTPGAGSVGGLHRRQVGHSGWPQPEPDTCASSPLGEEWGQEWGCCHPQQGSKACPELKGPVSSVQVGPSPAFSHAPRQPPGLQEETVGSHA